MTIDDAITAYQQAKAAVTHAAEEKATAAAICTQAQARNFSAITAKDIATATLTSAQKQLHDCVILQLGP